MLNRLKYFDSINKLYYVDIDEMAKSLGIDTSEEIVNFSEIADKTDDELRNILLATVSWLEHIGYKKALLKGVILKQKENFNKVKANKYKEIKENLTVNGNKVRASDIEAEIESSSDLVTFREKIILYEAYYEYIDGLFEVVHLLHYSIKTLLTNNNDLWRKSI